MKTQTLYYLILILTTLSCKAQILPVESYSNYINSENGIPEHITHIKDVNNLLNKFVGRWIGAFDNKSFELIITINTENFDGLLIDRLKVIHKITNSNGVILEDTIGSHDSSIGIFGYYLNESGSYVLIYTGNEAVCGQFGDLFISVGYNNSNNNMRLGLSPGRDIITADCPNGTAIQIFPADGQGMTLVKQ